MFASFSVFNLDNSSVNEKENKQSYKELVVGGVNYPTKSGQENTQSTSPKGNRPKKTKSNIG